MCQIHIHIAEQTAEVDDCLATTGQRPIEWLAAHVPLDARWRLSLHATHSTPVEIDAVARSGAGVVLLDEANLGDGLADVPGWLTASVPLSIGSDSHVTRDWREELRWLEYGQRLHLRRRNVGAAPGKGQPSTAARLFARALAGGRRAAGVERWVMQVGARADLLVIDTEDASLLGVPPDDILDALAALEPRPAVPRRLRGRTLGGPRRPRPSAGRDRGRPLRGRDAGVRRRRAAVGYIAWRPCPTSRRRWSSLDAPAMTRNITRMAEAAAAGGKRLRPHGKTHKSGWIARQQVAAGAVGLTCAKPGEAEVFAAAGIEDMRIAYPLSPTYAPRVLALMDRVRLSIVVDDLGVAQAWSDAMQRAGRRLPVLVKIDVGTHRCGVDPRERDAVAFITPVNRMPGIELRGLLSHAGHSYAATSVADVARIAREEIALLAELARGASRTRWRFPEISVGVDAAGAGQRHARRHHGAATRQLRVPRPDAGRARRRRLVGMRAARSRLGRLVSGGRPHRARFGQQGAVLGRRPRLRRRGAGLWRRPRAGRAADESLLIERLSEEHAVVRVTGAPGSASATG